MRAVEGRVLFRGFETWYRDVGPEDGVPLLCLHGGPGSTHSGNGSSRQTWRRANCLSATASSSASGSRNRPASDAQVSAAVGGAFNVRLTRPAGFPSTYSIASIEPHDVPSR